MSKATNVTLTGGEAVVRALEAHGVEFIFGIPGTHNLPIYKHLARSKMRHVSPRHEQGAGFAADGYARVSGRPGVCLVTTGPGVINLATAAAQAYSDSIPMLIISPGMPGDIYRRDVGYTHEAKDQSRAMGSLISWSHRATSPSDVARSIYRAFWEFGSRRPRPVHVEIPLEVLEAKEPVSLTPPISISPPKVSPACIREAISILTTSDRPGLLLGGGAQGAAAEVRELAHALGAVVVTSINGKGVYPENGELAVCAALTYPAARHALAECDAVVVVGSELSNVDTNHQRLSLSGRVIRIDIDSGQLNKNLTADCAIHGDAAIAVRQLLAGLKARSASTGAARAREARRQLAHEVEARVGGLLEAAKAIQSCIADDAIVVCDTSMLCSHAIIPTPLIKSPRSFLLPTGFGTLGYALPAGIGAKLAAPDREVLVVIGDGGILFTLSELAAAVEQELQLPIVITNNGGYAEIRQGMMSRGIEPLGVTFDPPNFSLLARAFGAKGTVVSDSRQLVRALRTAYKSDGPTLIEVTF